MSQGTEIRIPANERPNKHGDKPYYIMQEVGKDITINLKHWFIQLLPSEEEGEPGTFVLRERRPKFDNGNGREEEL